MVVHKPFSAHRPAPEYAAKIASPPYDVVSEDEARRLLVASPMSFISVIRPDVHYPEGTKPKTTEDMYKRAREELESLIKSGKLVTDTTPGGCYYIYSISWRGTTQTGVVALSSVADYQDNTIKRHEHTRPVKEQDRVDHVRACGANTGPVFLAYRGVEEINATVNQWTRDHKPVYSFNMESAGDTRHEVWVVNDLGIVQRLSKDFAERVPAVYIADGHHRAAAAARVGGADGGSGSSGHFMSVLFPHDQLQILGYHRIIKALPSNLTIDSFVDKLSSEFAVTSIDKFEEPANRREIHMYTRGGRAFRLVLKGDTSNDSNPVKDLDVAILQDRVLAPLLGIEDPRHDDNIAFVGGVRGASHLQKLVDGEEADIAFAMFPTSITELFTVADSGDVMPPKSTWFEPKLASGLFVYKFADTE